MMYTSQEGQFYLSQARALGAVDVLPKSLAPADVERVLRSHHLIGAPRSGPVDGDRAGIDDHQILIMRLRSMLDEQAAMLMSEFRREIDRADEVSAARLRLLRDELGQKPQATAHARLAAGAGLATLALAAAVAIPYLSDNLTTDEIGGPQGVVATDAAVAHDEDPAIPDSTGAAESRPAPTIGGAARVAGLTQHYSHDAAPLDDERARGYAPLMAELAHEGFAGTVTLEIHEGRYCVNYAADGSSQLAPPDQPAATCDYIGPLQSGAGLALQSPMFADMIAAATRDGRFDVDTVVHGAAAPIIDYPGLDYSVTAGYWNSIADVNQRISMRIAGADVAADDRFANLGR
jgi:hypothetical protein